MIEDWLNVLANYRLKPVLPIIQRTPDRMYSRVNGDCYAWLKGCWVTITREQFRVVTRKEKLETCDLELIR